MGWVWAEGNEGQEVINRERRRVLRVGGITCGPTPLNSLTVEEPQLRRAVFFADPNRTLLTADHVGGGLGKASVSHSNRSESPASVADWLNAGARMGVSKRLTFST